MGGWSYRVDDVNCLGGSSTCRSTGANLRAQRFLPHRPMSALSGFTRHLRRRPSPRDVREQQGSESLGDALTVVVAAMGASNTQRPILGAASFDVQRQLDAAKAMTSGDHQPAQCGSPLAADVGENA